MSARPVVVDANIVFSLLVSGRSGLAQRFGFPGIEISAPNFLAAELFKHRNRIVSAARVLEEEVVRAYYAVMMRINFCNESQIPVGTWIEAHRLCMEIDENDMPYVALALHLDADFWTEDLVLKTGLRARGFDRFFEP